jgi:SpoIID/LytB domain protein
MLHRALPLILSFTLLQISPSSANEIPQSFTFQGAGYGHGVGMSQFGARGQALEGNNAIDILQYYYKDISIEDLRDDQNLRVNIGHLLSLFSIRTDTKSARMQLFTGDVSDTTTAQPIKVVPSKASLNFTLLGNIAIPSVTSTSGAVEPLPSGKSWTIRWSGTRYLTGSSSIVTFKNGAVNTKYKYGQIQVKLVKVSLLGYRIEVTNTVRLHDEYLWGIGEMPSSWPLASLQAQAIASRSYALSKLGKRKSSCDCDIYGSSKDQSFVGYIKESEPKYGKIWKEAVTSTSVNHETGLVALFNSVPISAYFFSSSGGQTESAKNAWGSDIPYTQSVADPWSLDPVSNPRYFQWERTISQSYIAIAFGLQDVVSLQVNGKYPSGMVSTILGVSSSGATVLLTGTIFASRTKLPSAWFDTYGVTMSDASPSPTPTVTEMDTVTSTAGVS